MSDSNGGHELEKRNLNVPALFETRLTKTGSMVHHGYTKKKGELREAVIDFAIKIQLLKQNQALVKDWLMSMRLLLKDNSNISIPLP